MTTVRKISLTDTAKIVRQKLRAEFPGTKFSVRSLRYTGGSSITVTYDVSEDELPSYMDIYDLLWEFQGSFFDPMTDSKSNRTAELDGESVQYGNDYIFVQPNYNF